jgi:hypothetical protein
MSLLSLLLAAGSLPTLILGAPLPSILSKPGLPKRSTDSYKFYSGDGVTPPWPTIDEWVGTFDDMFSFNMEIITGSCSQFGVPNNSEQEIQDVSTGIQTVAGETGVDPRFILAILLQESKGCVRAPTTNYGVNNPGLMQDYDGSASCNIGGNIQHPCPANTITQMIRDGVAGTTGPGLVQDLAQAGCEDVSKYYKAARIYNSGSIPVSGDLGAPGATPCYASDIANRLTGWSLAENSCTLGGRPVTPGGTPVQESGGVATSAAAPASTPSQSTAVAPSVPASSATVQNATPTPSPSAPPQSPYPTPSNAPASPDDSSSGSEEPTAKLAPGVTSNCSKYYTVQKDDTCVSVAQMFSTTFTQLQTLNTELDSGCSNLWLGYAYCVAA